MAKVSSKISQEQQRSLAVVTVLWEALLRRVVLEEDGGVCCVCDCSPRKKVLSDRLVRQFFPKAAIPVSPSLLLLSETEQFLKAGVEFVRWDGYRHVKQHCTGAFIHLWSNTLTLRAGCLNSYKLRETEHVPSSINVPAFLRAEAPLSHSTPGCHADTSIP